MKIASIGLLVAEFDPIKGPSAIGITPAILSQEDQTFLALKSIDMPYYQNDENLSNFIVEYPSLKLKALVSPFKWYDNKLRGTTGLGTLILFFEEHLDVVFYKYRTDFTLLLVNSVEVIRDQRQKGVDLNFTPILEQLYKSIQQLWENLASRELNTNSFIDFPDDYEVDQDPDASYKILILGDPMVGKTSTVLRYTDNAFRQSYLITIGVNVSVKNIYHNSKYIIFTLWDVAGQAKFSTIRPIFYRGSDAAILVFDLTNPESFYNIEKWYYDLKAKYPNFSKLKVILVGNKADLIEKIKVTQTMISNFTEKVGIPYLPTSALTGENVEAVFTKLITLFE